MKFRKKPVVIDALQWRGVNFAEVQAFMEPNQPGLDHWDGQAHIRIDTLEGAVWASPGDWVIRGVKGEYYPCKPDIFEMTYEQA